MSGSMQGLCAQPDNSRVLCSNWHASSTKTTLGCTSSGIQIYRNPMHTWAHSLTEKLMLCCQEPDEDGHEEYSLTGLE
eukprot:366564-Chlamydomonas_euryale.AAC.17